MAARRPDDPAQEDAENTGMDSGRRRVRFPSRSSR
jgi:hypothetical protein